MKHKPIFHERCNRTNGRPRRSIGRARLNSETQVTEAAGKCKACITRARRDEAQLAGNLAVTSIVPGVTSVTVTVFPAMMPHGFEHSSEFCAAVKVSALAPAGAPTLRARANPAA